MEENKKKLGNEPAFPITEEQMDRIENYPDMSAMGGMSKRFYAACAAKNDFYSLHSDVQAQIVGEKHNGIDSDGYAVWLAKGRAKWMYMQADELLRQEEL